MAKPLGETFVGSIVNWMGTWMKRTCTPSPRLSEAVIRRGEHPEAIQKMMMTMILISEGTGPEASTAICMAAWMQGGEAKTETTRPRDTGAVMGMKGSLHRAGVVDTERKLLLRFPTFRGMLILRRFTLRGMKWFITLPPRKLSTLR